MKSHRSQSRRKTRPGFTLIELVVMIAIAVILLGLILPALQDNRRDMRRTQCLNNIRNLGLGCINFAGGNNDKLPLLEDSPIGVNGRLSTAGDGSKQYPTQNPGKSWVAQIIGYLDQAAIGRQIAQNEGIFNPGTGMPFVPLNMVLANSSQIALPVIGSYTCPNDSTNSLRPGGLSYVANAGYIAGPNWRGTEIDYVTPQPDYGPIAHDSTRLDWSGSTTAAAAGPLDQKIAHATGVFWRNDASGFRMTQDFIQQNDGLSNTFLLAENVNAGYWADLAVSTRNGGSVPSRRDLQTGYIGFGISVAVGTNYAKTGRPPFYQVDTTMPTGAFHIGSGRDLELQTRPAAYALTDSTTGTPLPNDAQIDSNSLTSVDGQSPRPSSNHPGLVIFCFADGHALPLSQNIDIGVYMRAISPAGALFGQPFKDNEVK